MPEPHLTPEQIAAVRDDELRDWAVIRHLQTCSACRGHLREARALRVLLSPPEAQASPHPDPEELAAYAEEALPTRDTRRLVAHLAACPHCFADLEAIRLQLRPGATTEDAPPAALVVAAVQNFQPVRPFMDLGRVVVTWLRRLGLALEYEPPYPSDAEDLPRISESRQMGDGSELLGRRLGQEDWAPPSFESTGRVAYNRDIPPDASAPAGPAEPPEQEATPVEVPVRDLQVRLTARGRTRDDLRLTLLITHQSDGAPVTDVRLTLETDEETIGPITTDAAGVAEFPLPPGQATLAFESPIRAQLKISF